MSQKSLLTIIFTKSKLLKQPFSAIHLTFHLANDETSLYQKLKLELGCRMIKSAKPV